MASLSSLSSRIPAPLLNAFRPAYPLVRAAQLWNEAGGMRMSAAMSFYGILSLAPLLIVLVAVLGWWIDRDALQRGLVAQIATIVGDQGGALIRQALSSAKEPADGLLASLAGFAVLLFGATNVFSELQEAFERLWLQGKPAAARQQWWHGASLRLRGVAYVLAFGFLLLVSLAISTLLNLFAGWAGTRLPVEQVLLVLNEIVAFFICAALFFGLMRMSAGPKPGMRYLVLGAFVGATLFTVGRHLLAVYLSTAAVVSAYGAAGSLVVLLMWIYFSAAVLLYAAGCARAVEEERQLRDGRNAAASGRGQGAPLGRDESDDRDHARA
ncbi:MAG: YihY/virulence factor BrkB family protein [Burkholderiales bacterium]|nr:YihY/virulence factor BrkB family protein [Burkholderiales bacterium]